jgi:ribosomal protein S18 acetylase RimI-like enzyme
MRIERLGPGDDSRVSEAGSLFDKPADPAATADFLARPDHYLFVAYEGEAPAGFASGVLLVHPDKGREMFLYELAVAEPFRRRGHGRALVERLAAAAREANCYGMWVLTDDDNAAALATYETAGGRRTSSSRMLEWEWPRKRSG